MPLDPSKYTKKLITKDESTTLTSDTQSLNFTGAGVTAIVSQGEVTVDIPGGAGSAYSTIQEEGSDLTQRTKLNFVGSGITASDNAGSTRTDVTLATNLNTYASKTPPSGDVVGTSDSQTLTNKTLTTPTIGDFTNATHVHQGNSSGGQLSATYVFSEGTVPTARLGSGTANSSTFLRGDQTWAEPPGGSGGFALAGSDTVENTTTSATPSDLITISGLSITAGTPFRIMFSFRKSSGAAATVGFGLKLNSTVVMEANVVAWTSGTNQAENGTCVIDVNASSTNYLRNGRIGFVDLSSAGSQLERIYGFESADNPNATITSIAIRGMSNSTSVTAGVKNVFVWTYPIT